MDCLVIKLKAAVNDNTLSRLGIIVCNFVDNAASGGQFIVNTISGKSIVAKCVGSTFTNGDSTKTLDYGSGGVLLRTGTFNVEFKEKYFIRTFNASAFGTAFLCNVNDLQDADGLEVVNLQATKAYGDISAFAGKTGLTMLNLLNTDVEGDIANIAGCTELTRFFASPKCSGNIASLATLTKCTSLRVSSAGQVTGDIASVGNILVTDFAVSNSGVSGRFEDFVAAQRLAGRTSYTTTGTWYLQDCGVTFNGQPISASSPAGAISWTDTTITVNGTTINA